MRSLAAALLLVTGFVFGAEPAIDVTVIEPGGAPAAEALVACIDGSHESAATDDRGHATLAQPCRRVWCEDGRFLKVEARVVDHAASCRLLAGAQLIVQPVPDWCALGCLFALVDETRHTEQFAHHRPPDADDPEFLNRAAQRVRFPLVPPGTYRLGAGLNLDWVCVADPVTLEAGERVVPAPPWRAPVEVRGTVVDAKGRPRANVLVRAKRDPARAGSFCASWTDAEAITNGEGRFVVPIDPEADTAILAGEAGDPLGTGEAPLTGADGSVSITLSGR